MVDLPRLEQIGADNRASEARAYLTRFVGIEAYESYVNPSYVQVLTEKIQELERDALEMATALEMFYNSYKWNEFEPFYDSETWERWGPRAAGKEQDGNTD